MQDDISLPMISTKAIGSTRISTYHSLHSFNKGPPFEPSPPTQLPIAFLFWFHILLLIILTLLAVFTRSVNLNDYYYQYYTDVYYFFAQEMNWRVFWKLCVLSTFGGFSSFLFLLCWGIGIWTIPIITIYFCIIISLVLVVSVCTIAFYFKFYFVGCVSILFFFVLLFGCFYHRKHVLATSKLYSIVIRIFKNISINIWLFSLFSFVIIYSIWACIIGISILCVQQFAVISDFLGLLSIIYVLFSWFWTTKVIKNIGGVIAGSVVGKWYFYQESIIEGIKSGQDTAICSLGSICFGSLLIPFVSLISFFAKKPTTGIYSQCNPFAFTHICLYGTTLLDASTNALRIFTVNGITSLLNDTAIGSIGTVAAIGTGTIGSLVAGIFGVLYSDYGGTLLVIGFLTGYGLGDVIMEILDASLLVLLMCICEDTSSLSSRTPTLEQYLKENYLNECSSLFSSRSV